MLCLRFLLPLMVSLALMACDQALEARYEGLEVVEVVEVVDTREDALADEQSDDLFDGETVASGRIALPMPRPSAMSIAGLTALDTTPDIETLEEGANGDVENEVVLLDGADPEEPALIVNTADERALAQQQEEAAQQAANQAAVEAAEEAQLAELARREEAQAAEQTQGPRLPHRPLPLLPRLPHWPPPSLVCLRH